MSFVIPTGWEFHSSSKDGSSITLIREGHSVKEPRLALLSRVTPVYDSARELWSVPSYRVRIVDGVTSGSLKPDPTRTLADCTFRYSINSDGGTRMDEVVGDLLKLILQPSFVPDGLLAQKFPMLPAKP